MLTIFFKEFWSFFNFIKISSIQNGSILSVVKKSSNIPTTNYLGLESSKSKQLDLFGINEDLESLWIKILVFLIGEQITQTENILGSSFRKNSNGNDIIELLLTDTSKFCDIENDLIKRLKSKCINEENYGSPLSKPVNKSTNIQFKEPIIDDEATSPFTALTRYEKKKQTTSFENPSTINEGKEEDFHMAQSTTDSEKLIEKKKRRRNRSRGSRSKYVERATNGMNSNSPNKDSIMPLKSDLPSMVEMIQNSDVHKYTETERNFECSNHVTIAETLIRNSSFQNLNLSEQLEIEKKHKRKRSRSSKKKFALTFTTEHIFKILLIITILIFAMALYNFTGKITLVYECQK